MKKILITVFTLFICVSMFAQETKITFTLHLKSGDIISGYTAVRSIDFTTKYGTLRFPITDLTKIDLGIKDQNINRMDIYAELDKLHFGKAEELETIFDQLTAMEEGAIPYIKDYMSSPNYKPKTGSNFTVNTLYEVLLATHNMEKTYAVNDIVYFSNDHSVEGNYNFAVVSLETPYGKLEIERKRIKEIEVTVEEVGEGNLKTFKLNANKNISGNTQSGWLNTGMLVKAGNYVEIQSSGEITLASLSNNTYTPDGGVNGSPGLKDDKVNYGQVVYKVSESGTMKKAGANLDLTVEETGILYIAIYESVFSENNSGHYNVRVKVVE